MQINKVILYCNDLSVLKDFYVNRFGFTILRDVEDRFAIEIGNSVLEIIESKDMHAPFYHFAFNIPPNVFKQAKEWTKSKVALDEENGEDEVYFQFIDAHSIYFHDPSGNIVELIARKSSPQATDSESFSIKNLLNIGEISITTNEVIPVGKSLVEHRIPVRDNEQLISDGLNFLGDRDGGAFLLLTPENRRWFFSNTYSKIYPLTIYVDNEQQIIINDQGKIEVKNI
ncbi:VOC family protein [Ornithinibacillus salinisoli]|uniref:VOC family protein n=1 Tax=Ornithinibacillus salinisoli TaxID=1848459 RepID=A0ABW4W2U9_9BACI